MSEMIIELVDWYLKEEVTNPIVLHGQYYKDLISHMNRQLKVNANSRFLVFDVSITHSDRGGVTISVAHNGENRHNPSRGSVIDAFVGFINSNEVATCVYCSEQVSKKTASVFYKHDNVMCACCEKIAKDVIIRKRMEKEYDEYHAKDVISTSNVRRPPTIEAAGDL